VSPHAHETMDLSTGPEAPRTARAALEHWLEGLVSRSLAEDVRLAATELVTNAIRHGDLRPHDRVRMTMHLLGGVVRVEVLQPTPAQGVRVFPPSERPASGGFGLALVEATTDRWGVEAGPPGCVWFEVARSDGRGER
jgi:anti-sigma regulatory factor (Ser/Thr protein kinase)